MQRPILIHGARQLLTLHGGGGPRRGYALSQLGLIQDGAVLIGDGRIIEAGPSRRVENLSAAKRAEVIPAHGCVVMPAFIDPDTRSLRAPMAFGDKLPEHPIECPCTALTGPASRVRYEGEQTLAGMLRHGTATIETKAADIRTLRIISRMNSPIEVIPTLDAPGGLCDEVLGTVRQRGLARFVQCAASPSTIDTLQRARTYGFGARQCGGSNLVCETDAVIRPEGLGEDGIAALSTSDTVAVLAPGTGFHEGRGRYPPARELIARGAAVALATGYGPCTNPSYSMGVAISLACRRMGMSPAEAVAAATINAAHALGIARRAGSLEPGKQADILILETGDYRALAWEFGINLAGTVIKDGEVVYDSGRIRWLNN
jgi:imidazolonepropionase